MKTHHCLSDQARPIEADELFRALRDVGWDFPNAPVASGVHALHSYPAKFIPDVPRALISLLSRPGDLVLDPFCGGGTTGVEAVEAGRAYVGVDANAFAVLLSKLKLRHVTDTTRDLVTQHADRTSTVALTARATDWRPNIPNLHKWYDPVVFEELVALRASILSIADSDAVEIGLLALASSASKLSYQDSETRYVSKPKTMEPGATAKTYSREVRRMLSLLPDKAPGLPAHVILGDARASSSFATLANGSVDLAVTSPPYPNAYDYHLYHRFRLFWLGGDGPKDLRAVEVGSHLRNQTEAEPTEAYLRDMRRMFSEVRRVLRTDAYFALIVGSGVHKGEVFDTAEHLSYLANSLGFETFACFDRHLPTSRRSVTHTGRRLQTEQVLVLRATERKAQ